MDYQLLQDMLPQLAEYQASEPSPHTPEGFVAWASSQIQTPRDEPQAGEVGIGANHAAAPNMDTVLAMLVVKMYRYGKSYIKRGLDNMTSDEFVYLAGLEHEPGLSKVALIERNIQEKTTGMEIINRLLKKGWAKQEFNPEDRRKRQLFITEKGKEVFISCLPSMLTAGKIIGGGLDAEEKMQLINLLEKLDRFHEPIFSNSREESLKGVFSKYLGQA